MRLFTLSTCQNCNEQKKSLWPGSRVKKNKFTHGGTSDFGIHVTGYYEVPPWVILFFLRRLSGSSEIGKGILLVLSMTPAQKQCMDEYNICFSENKKKQVMFIE